MDASTVIGLAVGVTALLTAYSRVQSIISKSELRDLEMRKDIERILSKLENASLLRLSDVTGLKERIEHCNTRLSNQAKELERTVSAIEAYLQKNTSYEQRSNNQ